MMEIITLPEAYPVADSLDIIRELSAVRAAANIVNAELATKKINYDDMFNSQAVRVNDLDFAIQYIGNKLKENLCTGETRKRIKQIGAVASYFIESICFNSAGIDTAKEYMNLLKEKIGSEITPLEIDNFTQKFLSPATMRSYYDA